MNRRHPTTEEIALWRAALRDVIPLHGQSLPAPPPAPERSAAAASPPTQVAALADKDAASPRPARSRSLDKRTAQRLRRGEMEIDGRLDLHGMTEEEAHRTTVSYLARAQSSGVRLVLLITGKGAVLRQAVPRWLDEGATRARILATSPAQPRHGGGGALYVLLRRVR